MNDCPARPERPQPFLYALGLIVIPILIGESCVAFREWLKREHKAAIARRDPPPPSA